MTVAPREDGELKRLVGPGYNPIFAMGEKRPQFTLTKGSVDGQSSAGVQTVMG